MKNVHFTTVGNIFNQAKDNSNHRISPHEAQKNFSKYLRESINKVNDAQLHSDKMTEKLALGEPVDLHDVMISAQKANISLQATIEIRNKVIEAYQEIMRMQV